MTGFWIGLGLFALGLCIDSGLTNIAKAISKAVEVWRDRP